MHPNLATDTTILSRISFYELFLRKEKRL